MNGMNGVNGMGEHDEEKTKVKRNHFDEETLK
jgi:hypothetical protein